MDPQQKDFQTRVFEEFARKSPILIKIFPLAYLVTAFILAFAAYVDFTNNFLFDLVYKFGKFCGQLAVLILGTVLLPGILGRFMIEIKLTRTITLFRRQLGISVFLLGLVHYFLMRFLPIAAGIFPFSLPVGFELFGTGALFIFFFMFLTSNNYSVKKMGAWWKVLHRFVYVAIWLLVLHTGLQKISVWTLFIGIFAVLEVISWIYYFSSKSKQVLPQG